MSDCHPDGFTCTSGECVGLEKKCDALVDCGDGSDEEDCEFLVAADRYEKQSLPEALEEGDKVRVFFSIRISAFPEVDSAAFRVRSEYDLSLRWYDPRLRFRDLNNLTEFNDLGESDRTYLWSPRLEIPNALGVGSGSGDRKGGARAGGERLVDEAASLRLIKEDLEPLAEDFSLDREGTNFSPALKIIVRAISINYPYSKGVLGQDEFNRTDEEIFPTACLQVRTVLFPI